MLVPTVVDVDVDQFAAVWWKAVASAVAASRRIIKIAGHVVPCANVPSSMASEAGELLCEEMESFTLFNRAGDAGLVCKGTPYFSVTYHDGADGKRHFSLRSPEGGADVGQIAKQLADTFNRLRRGAGFDHSDPWTGGGHLHSVGFDAPLGWEGEP